MDNKLLVALGSGVAFVAAFILIIPLSALFGWFVGLVLKWICGSFIAGGLNLLFGTTRFTPDQLPMLFGAIATLSGYLRTQTTVKEK